MSERRRLRARSARVCVDDKGSYIDLGRGERLPAEVSRDEEKRLDSLGALAEDDEVLPGREGPVAAAPDANMVAPAAALALPAEPAAGAEAPKPPSRRSGAEGSR